MRIVTALFALLVSGLAMAATETGSVEVTRLYTGADGITHFAGETVVLEAQDFSPPTPPVAVSQQIPTKGLAFVSIPGLWFGDWHPAPRKQYVLVLSGILAVETGDGDKREFSAGDVLLVEDTSGKGHRTGVVGEPAALLAIVPADPQ